MWMKLPLLQEHDNPTCRSGRFVLSKVWQGMIGRENREKGLQNIWGNGHFKVTWEAGVRVARSYEGGKKIKGGVFPSGSLLQIFSWKQRIYSAVFGNKIKHTKPCIDKNR